MTAAEFKTLRQTLGLTPQWIADMVGVKRRTVEYWESGKMPIIPDDVIGLLQHVKQTVDILVMRGIALVDELIAIHGLSFGIVLIRYRTDEDLWRFHSDIKPMLATTHAIAMQRVQQLVLSSKDVICRIVYMEPVQYIDWLQDREDTPTERAVWAASLLNYPRFL